MAIFHGQKDCTLSVAVTNHNLVPSPLDPIPVIPPSSHTMAPLTAFPLRRFPHEICDVIIDQLKPKETVSPYGTVQWVINSRALKSCALVSREWRPRAQLWLVHYIWLASLECLRKLESFLDLKTQYIRRYVQFKFVTGTTRDIPFAIWQRQQSLWCEDVPI